ncbi:hypothetical protein Cgig2_020744 [Carnegiea gigantea]|uniref:Uncharacterized protein n=1 Tax=Carnegiea gigantea TaxID=171969 RepID=A0A9Q1JW76_9CARY|nr:hypothetical protein Cgig2_020744 [Carnegiea gigantea]
MTLLLHRFNNTRTIMLRSSCQLLHWFSNNANLGTKVEDFEIVTKVLSTFYTYRLGKHLCRPFIDIEIKGAIFSIPSTTSPGPDGYNSGFFKHIMDNLQSFTNHNSLKANMAKSHIILVVVQLNCNNNSKSVVKQKYVICKKGYVNQLCSFWEIIFGARVEFKRVPYISWHIVFIPKERRMEIKDMKSWDKEMALKKNVLWLRWIHGRYIRSVASSDYNPPPDSSWCWEKLCSVGYIQMGG